jgi:tetratricopeptide (TPR) repeat protein
MRDNVPPPLAIWGIVRMLRLLISTIALSVVAGLVLLSRAVADDLETCVSATGDEKIAACTRAIDSGRWQGPGVAWAFANRCSGYGSSGDNDRAIADCNEAIRLDPNYVLAYNKRGYAYAAKGDYERATVDFNEVKRLDAIARTSRARARASAVNPELHCIKYGVANALPLINACGRLYCDGTVADKAIKDGLILISDTLGNLQIASYESAMALNKFQKACKAYINTPGKSNEGLELDEVRAAYFAMELKLDVANELVEQIQLESDFRVVGSAVYNKYKDHGCSQNILEDTRRRLNDNRDIVLRLQNTVCSK